jgi:hypothetical protein
VNREIPFTRVRRIGESVNFETVMEVLVGMEEETNRDTINTGSFVYGQTLMNLELQRVIVLDWDSFLNSRMVFMASPFADAELDISEIISHPGFQEQPFGLQELEGFWHIVASVPLENLHEDLLVSIAYRAAFVANALASQFAKSEEDRQRFLFS